LGREAGVSIDFTAPAWYRHTQAKTERADLSNDPGHQAMSRAWMQRIDFGGIRRILDVGCADGWTMEQFKARGMEPVGVTLCEREAAVASHHGPVVVSDMHDFEAIQYAPFDACWLRHTLEHALAPFVVMKNIRRHLRESARLFVVLPSPAWDTMPTHYSPMSEHQFQALAGKTGFKPVEIRAAYHGMYGAIEGSPNDFEWWIEAVAI